MSHDARIVANNILLNAQASGSPITPMQLQKVVYFAHGWSLGTGLGPLTSTPFFAWEYGPVNREIYQAFRHYGALPIERPAPLSTTAKLLLEIDETHASLIAEIYDTYGHLSASQLVHLTHANGTPWHEVWRDGAGRNELISDELTKAHFAQLAEQQAVA